MNWLKDRPGLQMIFNGLITVIGLLLMYYIAKGDENSASVEKDIQTLKTEKASIVYVNEENSKLSSRINEVDEENSEISEKILKISTDVAWIRGYLDPHTKLE